MTKEFIPYEQALELKELGFDEACICYYDIEDSYKLKPTPMKEEVNAFHFNSTSIMVAAPLCQQAFRWFREKCDFYAEIFVDDDKTFGFLISSFIEKGELARIDKPIKRQFATYEEAELECLKWLIYARQRKHEAYS
jgi:hypothetical protein